MPATAGKTAYVYIQVMTGHISAVASVTVPGDAPIVNPDTSAMFLPHYQLETFFATTVTATILLLWQWARAFHGLSELYFIK